MTPDGAAQLLTVEEATAFMGLERQSLYRLTAAAHLWKYRKTPQGRVVLFKREDLQRLLEKQKLDDILRSAL